MLQKLNFDIDDMNKGDDNSVVYHRENNVIYSVTNPQHEIWSSIPHVEPLLVFYCKEMEPGVYLTGLNFEYDINKSGFEAYGTYHQLSKEGLPIESYKYEDFMKGISPYGVADNIEQVKEYAKDMISSDNPVVIALTEMRKDKEPENDGWRWEKWGQYIGKQDPQCEYLFDEPNIESVYVFHVYAVRPKVNKTLENTEDNKKENKKLKM